MDSIRRLTRRSILAGLAGLGAAGTTFAACGEDSLHPAAAPKSSQAARADTSVIRYLHLTTREQEWDDAFAAAIGRFEERNPALSVDLDAVPLPLKDVAEKALSAGAAGTPYDLYYGWSGYISRFSAANLIQPLEPFIAKDAGVDVSEFYPGAFERFGGKLYGIAWLLAAQFIWYNTDLIAERGLKAPADLDAAGAFDWDALTNLATQLTAHDGAGVTRWGLNFRGNAFASIMIALKSWGADWWNEDFTAAAIDSPEAAKAVQAALDHVVTHRVHPPVEVKRTDVEASFIQQTLGMSLAGPWFARTAQREIIEGEKPFALGLANVPHGPGGRGTPLLISALWIASGAPAPDATWEFYKHVISEATQPDWADIGGGRFPPNRTYAPVVQFPFESPETYQAIAEASVPLRQVVAQGRVDTVWGDLWSKMEVGEKTVAEAIAEARRVSDDLLQEGGCIC